MIKNTMFCFLVVKAFGGVFYFAITSVPQKSIGRVTDRFPRSESGSDMSIYSCLLTNPSPNL